MTTPPKYDPELWFETAHCQGRHFLTGNGHTFVGRMDAWCVDKETYFRVSKKGIGNCSTAAKYWVKGFLNGSQPAPPIDQPYDSPEFEWWRRSVDLFLETGQWDGSRRLCEGCCRELLPSSDWFCPDCQKVGNKKAATTEQCLEAIEELSDIANTTVFTVSSQESKSEPWTHQEATYTLREAVAKARNLRGPQNGRFLGGPNCVELGERQAFHAFLEQRETTPVIPARYVGCFFRARPYLR